VEICRSFNNGVDPDIRAQYLINPKVKIIDIPFSLFGAITRDMRNCRNINMDYLM
jgi:hypothetical protein